VWTKFFSVVMLTLHPLSHVRGLRSIYICMIGGQLYPPDSLVPQPITAIILCKGLFWCEGFHLCVRLFCYEGFTMLVCLKVLTFLRFCDVNCFNKFSPLWCAERLWCVLHLFSERSLFGFGN
jgi:hypothetical protein